MIRLPLALYRAVTDAAIGPIEAYLRARQRRGKEDAARAGERRGRPGMARPDGPLVWVHGASVGEALSALPLIEALRQRRPALNILVTTGTVTSARLLADRLPPGAVHQYVPVDRAPWVRAFLDHWRPDAVVWLESDLWPNMLAAIGLRGLPAALVNARISERSARRWARWAPGSARRLLSVFACCLAQSQADAERLRRLGAPAVATLGNLKLAAAPLPADPAALEVMRQALAGRPVWLAASTHEGEEALAGEVHRRLQARHPGLLTIIVPRHHLRGAAIAASLRGQGLAVARRGDGSIPDASDQIYLADTMGELGLFYRLSQIAFVGKSLRGHGGQNPLEPARLGCALVCGPHMENFAEIVAGLRAADALETVADGDGLAAAIDALLSDPDLRARRAAAARGHAEAAAGVVERMLDAVVPLLPPAPEAAAQGTT